MPSIVVTTLRPGIVIIDKQTKEVNISELTVPGKTRIKISHDLKCQNINTLILILGAMQLTSYHLKLAPKLAIYPTKTKVIYRSFTSSARKTLCLKIHTEYLCSECVIILLHI